jgi:hypothetical protein
MASPVPFELPHRSVRERVARAVCARHGEGKNAPVCELGQTVTDAALAEVRVWLLEMADRNHALAAEYGTASPLARLVAGDEGMVRGIADLVGEGLPEGVRGG